MLYSTTPEDILSFHQKHAALENEQAIRRYNRAKGLPLTNDKEYHAAQQAYLAAAANLAPHFLNDLEKLQTSIKLKEFAAKVKEEKAKNGEDAAHELAQKILKEQSDPPAEVFVPEEITWERPRVSPSDPNL